MPEEKKKAASAEGFFQMKIRPIEYEAKGLLLKNILNLALNKSLKSLGNLT